LRFKQESVARVTVITVVAMSIVNDIQVLFKFIFYLQKLLLLFKNVFKLLLKNLFKNARIRMLSYSLLIILFGTNISYIFLNYAILSIIISLHPYILSMPVSTFVSFILFIFLENTEFIYSSKSLC